MPTPDLSPVRAGAAASAQSLLRKDSSNLDLLRAIAVLAVFISHLLYTFGIRQILSVEVKPLGTVGVLIFFVHTSLVLMMSMERLHLTGWRLFAAFYVRRIFRIYPLSIFCVIAVVALQIPRMPWDAAFEPVSTRALITNLLLAQNLNWTAPVIGSLWSLPYEVEMYVVLPLLFLLVRRFRQPAVAAGLWALSVVAGIVELRVTHIPAFDIFQFAPCFLGGVAAYQLSKRIPARRRFWLWPTAILVLMAVYIGFAAATRGWVECLLLGLAAPQFCESGVTWLKRAAHAVAQYSYGIYLLHAPLMWVCFKALRAPSAVQWVVFAVSMVVSCLAAYHWLEAPLLQVGGELAKRLVRRLPSKPAAGTQLQPHAQTTPANLKLKTEAEG